MICINPDCTNSNIFARGYCQGCYTRLRRTGSLTRRNVVNRGKCIVEGCDKHSFSKNLCSAHYQSSRHPLYSIWRNLRSRAKGDYPPAWDRFDTFLAVVGDQPSEKSQFRRVDPSKPWSGENFEWLEPIGLSTTDMAAYQRKWSLRDKYNLTPEQFEQMMKDQDGKCAICKCDITGVEDTRKRKLKAHIDHDHKTNKVRGLLCDTDNKAIGWFYDDIERMESAIAYLKSHKH